MAHFASYNTFDKNTGNVALQKEQEWDSGMIQTEKAEYIAGSVFSDQAGTLKVQQSFDGGEHWDISESIAVSANEGKGFRVAILAPWVKLVYKNGATNQGGMRLFARTFVQGA